MIDIINEWWEIILVLIAIYEGLSRLIPTYKNYSLIDFVTEILKVIKNGIERFIPNKKRQ